MLKLLIREMRIWQWTKNLLVLAGVVFSMQVMVSGQVLRALAGMGIFCLLSSATYLFNDLHDLEQDGLHPRKRLRPIASGRMSQHAAWIIAATLVVVSFALAIALSPRFAVVAAIYLLLSVSYTVAFKRVVLLDVLIVAMGFVLRAVAGVEVLSPRPLISPWLLVCTLFLALFLAVGKRRHERLALSEDACMHRATLAEYSPQLLDQLVPIVTTSAVLAYSIYAISPATPGRAPAAEMVYTIPFVVYGVFRYLYLVYRRGEGGAPSELLLADRPLLASIALWGLVVLVILYLR